MVLLRVAAWTQLILDIVHAEGVVKDSVAKDSARLLRYDLSIRVLQCR